MEVFMIMERWKFLMGFSIMDYLDVKGPNLGL